MKRIPSVLLALTVAACTEGGTGPGTLPDLNHDPILFIHGISGSATSLAPLRARFAADGWNNNFELFAYTYSSVSSNAVTAQEIRDQVNQIIATTGASRVDIIAHSMGSLSSRYYLKNFGTDKVDSWVSLGGPNHGTAQAADCPQVSTACQEMVIGSAFLTALNSGDETPGLVRYATWASPCDALVPQVQSVFLNGATNTQTACIAHSQLYTDPVIYAQVRSFVE